MKLQLGVFALVGSLTGCALQPAPRLPEGPRLNDEILAHLKKLYLEDAPTVLARGPAPEGTGASDLPSTVDSSVTSRSVESQNTSARRGDIAKGVIIATTDGGRILLDSRPCKGEILAFRKPVVQTQSQQIRCGGRTLRLVILEQK